MKQTPLIQIPLKQIIIIILFSLAFTACTNNDYPNLDKPAGIFAAGKAEFSEKNYMESEKFFNKIKLQYSASLFADSSQYYLAEISYARKEYILAAFNYSILERHYPASGLKKIARYKNAQCYYDLSPSFQRDQAYTKKAIGLYQSFKDLYPGDSLFFEAKKRIDELTQKLAQQEFSIAELYAKIDDPKAAIIYYNSVIDQYIESPYYEKSFIGKIKMQLLMEKYELARSTMNVYKIKFAEHINNSEIVEFERIILHGSN